MIKCLKTALFQFRKDHALFTGPNVPQIIERREPAGWVILLLLIPPGSSTCAMTQYATSTMIGRGWTRESPLSNQGCFAIQHVLGSGKGKHCFVEPCYVRIVNFRAINKSMPRKERLKREREKERQTEATKYWQLGHFWSTMISIYKFTYCLSACLSVDTLYLRSRPTDLGEWGIK